MENKMTAVEWLKMKLEDENSQNEYINPLNPDKISFKYIEFLLDCALKMEKEQNNTTTKNIQNEKKD